MSIPALDNLLRLVALLPVGLRADWDGSNHYELTTSDESYPWWWLNLSDYMLEDFDSATDEGRRVGLLLDLAAAAKAAEPVLLTLSELPAL